MGYTLGQAAKAVGMSKTSILRSIKAGRISAGRDEFGQWAIEPCELHRVYPPLADDTGTGNGTEERGVTGGEPALPTPTFGDSSIPLTGGKSSWARGFSRPFRDMSYVRRCLERDCATLSKPSQ